MGTRATSPGYIRLCAEETEERNGASDRLADRRNLKCYLKNLPENEFQTIKMTRNIYKSTGGGDQTYSYLQV